ncbi:HD-GYP domain-containing protein [Roseomonas marmotae]|uniref:HD domain-containing protein n=1 Tax=Roseomonas marmotae TaxID=2768161 RepID=A0ABS3K8T9_9PROT|nr:HD domain-containing phosphohydrolase [Roseomonas marmotae]MBO1073879.1 HD domain-containing protein [Roseomonas marmotae]QTI78499.1 HD domain-containing protein [Roseomonas marmotae]
MSATVPYPTLERIPQTDIPASVADSDLSRQSLRLLAALRRHHAPSADHSIRVATVLLAMSSCAGTTLGDPALIVATGLMHDLGKLFLPASLLSAPRGLSRPELEAIRAHPVTGAETLAALRFPEEVILVARDHHERWNGGGYPSGRPGKMLSPLARAVSVADAFVAMIEPGRAYRPRLTVAEALAEVEACSGTQFDPRFAQLLVQGLGPAFRQELGLDAAPGRWKPRAGEGLLLSHRLEHALRLPPCPW